MKRETGVKVSQNLFYEGRMSYNLLQCFRVIVELL